MKARHLLTKLDSRGIRKSQFYYTKKKKQNKKTVLVASEIIRYRNK